MRMQCGAEIALRTGDVAVLHRGREVLIADDQSIEPRSVETSQSDLAIPEMHVRRFGGGGNRTLIICRVVAFEHATAKRLLERLPPVIHIESSSVAHADWIKATLERIASEIDNKEQGGDILAMHLTDALVIEAVRSWLIRNPNILSGGLAPLADWRIARAVDLMHQKPESGWTLETLAKATGMSRSAFSERFGEVVGLPAMRYLTQLRMSLALAKLADSGESISAIAEHLGYSSEAAFCRAFRRYHGVPPSAIRKLRRPQQGIANTDSFGAR